MRSADGSGIGGLGGSAIHPLALGDVKILEGGRLGFEECKALVQMLWVLGRLWVGKKGLEFFRGE